MFLILVSSILFLNSIVMNGEESNDISFQMNKPSRIPVLNEMERYQKEVDFQELYSFVARRMKASMDTLRFYPELMVFSESFQDERSFTESLHLYRPRTLSKKELIASIPSKIKSYLKSGLFNINEYSKLRKKFDCVGYVFIYNDKGEFLKTFSLWENHFVHPSWGIQIWNLSNYPKVEYLLKFDCWGDYYFIHSEENNLEIIESKLYHQFERISWDEFYHVLKKFRGSRIAFPVTDLVRKYPVQSDLQS